MIRIAFILWLLAPCFPALAADTGALEVTVTGIRSANGHILVAVCDRATFLSPKCAYVGKAVAHSGAVVVTVAGVPPGVYAVQAYQDENDNNKIDRTFFGLPKEGMGFSRDAPIRLGPPNFDDAAVRVEPGGGALSFAIRYFD